MSTLIPGLWNIVITTSKKTFELEGVVFWPAGQNTIEITVNELLPPSDLEILDAIEANKETVTFSVEPKMCYKATELGYAPCECDTATKDYFSDDGTGTLSWILYPNKIKIIITFTSVG